MKCALPLLALCLTPSVASADVIISNLADPTISSTLFGTGSTTQYKAFGFTMGSAAMTLDEVVLVLDSTSANPTPLVRIHADMGGSPGAALFTLDNPAVLTGPGDFLFTAGSAFTLDANTTYWLHVTSVPVAGDAFRWISTDVLPAGPGAAAVGYEFNGGSSSFFNKLEVRGSSGIGTNYCGPAAPNSSGASAVASADGSTVAASNQVTLSASGMPANQFGIFVASMAPGFVPGASGTSNGNLCLGGTIGRLRDPNQILGTGTAGAFSLGIDLTSIPQGSGTVAVIGGQSWYFQAWFRDGVGLGSNFTDGLRIDFQ